MNERTRSSPTYFAESMTDSEFSSRMRSLIERIGDTRSISFFAFGLTSMTRYADISWSPVVSPGVQKWLSGMLENGHGELGDDDERGDYAFVDPWQTI